MDPVGFEDGGWNLYQYVLNQPTLLQDPSGNVPIWLEQRFKDEGYHFWRANYVTAPQWQTMLDNWYYELPPNPIRIIGLADRRNTDIATNQGFIKLRNCWLAKTVSGAKVPVGRWIVDAVGVTWEYTYDPAEAAGGALAFTSATHFLGSYRADFTLLTPGPAPGKLCDIDVRVTNTSGWTSATRIPGRFRWIFGSSLFKTTHEDLDHIVPAGAETTIRFTRSL